MADEMFSRIEKQLEGNNLALSAVAEILQKMDSRMSEQEEVAIAKQEEEEAAADRQALIKEIASEVATIIKADAGMDVDGSPRPAKGTGKTPADADDSEAPANVSTAIEDQQSTIQAMAKDDDDDDDEEVEKGHNGHDDDEEVDKGTMYKAEDGEDDDKDMEKEDDDDDEEVADMKKQLAELQKQIADYEVNMQKAIRTESEDRLRKMGFREETSLNAPKMVDSLGVDGTDVLQKGADDTDTVDQLTNLSYKELRLLQTNIEQCKTDGVPKELLG